MCKSLKNHLTEEDIGWPEHKKGDQCHWSLEK